METNYNELKYTISYETLKALIGRATDSHKLWIADEWLRENKTISIPEYQQLRKFWNTMYKRYGTWKVIIRCGTVKHDYASGTFTEMLQLCRDSHWRHNHNNGCWWDMEITEA